ncbi:MAG: TetR/AcrR family transcriptional regulator [Deltaproteobacteria bacterium]|nr:TetR/AcrR family transcriptional regulator [Deltaproteobacteria bacterium]
MTANRSESFTRHHDEKLREILKSSAKIFAEKGFHRTSIRDIARATDMSLAGLYYYFRTKEELLFLIQEQCFVTLLQRWEKTGDLSGDVRVRIRTFVENHLGFFLHNMYEMKVMAHEDESLTGKFQEKMLVLKRRYVKVLMDLIEEMQSPEGGKGINLRAATFSLFGMMNWIYTWYHPNPDLPLPELIDQMLRIYFFGILKGGKAQEPWFTPSSADPGKEGFSLWQNLP